MGAAGGLSTWVGRAPAFFLPSRHTGYMQRWSFTLHHGLPTGTYVARVRAVDGAGNREVKHTHGGVGRARNFLTFKIQLFPTGSYVPLTEDPVGWASHLILPWFTLAVLFVGFYSRMLRSNMLDAMNEDLHTGWDPTDAP